MKDDPVASSHGDIFAIPDWNLLFDGDFTRCGINLIFSKDARQFVLHEDSKGEKRSALSSTDDACLAADIIKALAGDVRNAQASGGRDTANVIGHVAKLNGNATGIRNGASIILNVFAVVS